MRRQNIQLLAAVRQGDVAARFEVGRHYLKGSDGFPKHVPTGIDYLSHVSVKGLTQAAQIIVDSLPLEELLSLQQAQAVDDAARAGSASAQVKLGAWCCTSSKRRAEGLRWLEMAASTGHRGARLALQSAQALGGADPLPGVLLSLAHCGELNARAVAMLAARDALAAHDLARLCACLRAAITLAPCIDDEIAELVVAGVGLAEHSGGELGELAPAVVEQCLEMQCRHGNHAAAYTLGRALCGIAGALAPLQLTSGANVRKGTALLLRAADGGCNDAWLHLYRLSADHRSSVSNPQMARYFLEKAASHGKVEAQRKLGALLLREATQLIDTEEAIGWLSQAAASGDACARELLESLVLPLTGSDDDARGAIEDVRRSEPWLAVRLQISRHYGLTKLEALTMDPSDGLRPWGLVVGPNPFVSQARLSLPRAIPALSAHALSDLRQAAALFDADRRSAHAAEGDLRRRSLRQRRAFERHALNPSMFFAAATSTTLESLRQGSKWAFRARDSLRLALA